MSFLFPCFGYARAPNDRKPPSEEELILEKIANVQRRIESLDQESRTNNEKITALQKRYKLAGSAFEKKGIKRDMASLMRRNLQYERNIEYLDRVKESAMNAKDGIDNGAAAHEALELMQIATRTLMAQATRVRDPERTMEDLQLAQEDATRMQDSLSTPIGGPSQVDQDIERELDAILADDDDYHTETATETTSLMRTTPVLASKAPSKAAAAQRTLVALEMQDIGF